MARRDPAAARAGREKMSQEAAKPNAHAPVGQGGRFAAMVAAGVPPGVAAHQGRAKYGKARFQRMAAAGRKRRG